MHSIHTFFSPFYFPLLHLSLLRMRYTTQKNVAEYKYGVKKVLKKNAEIEKERTYVPKCA